MPAITTLVDGAVPVAADFNGNYTALNNAIGSSTAISSYTTGDTVYASATNALSRLAKGLDTQAYLQVAGIPSWGFTGGHLFGLTLSNNVADATNDIDLAVGEAVSDDATTAARVLMRLTTALTKQLDVNWVVGTNQGMLDTGAIANGTYHLFLIERTDTGVVDLLASTSASAPTMPTSYNKKRRIGSIVRTGAAIKAFVQDGDYFLWLATVADVSANNPGTGAVSRTLTVPTGINTFAAVHAWTTTGINTFTLLTDLAATDVAAAQGASDYVSTASLTGQHTLTVRTNTSAQIRSRLSASDATVTLNITTYGWLDYRGRNA